MKKIKLFLLTVILIICSQFIIACGSKTETDNVLSDLGTSNTNSSDKNEEIGETYIVIPIKEFHDVVIDETVFQDHLYYLTYEKVGSNLDIEKAVLVRIDLEEPVTPEIMYLDIPSNQRLNKLAVGDDKSIHILTIEQDENWELVDMFWYRVDSNGNINNTTVITEIIREHGSTALQEFAVDIDDNAYIASSSFKNQNYTDSICVISSIGELVFQTPIKGIVWFMLKDTEGKIYAHHNATGLAVEGFTTHVISQVNIEKKSLDQIDITAYSSERGGFMGLNFENKNTLFFVNSSGAYDADLENDILNERFNWSSLAMRPSFAGRAYLYSDGRILWANWPEGAGYGSLNAVPFSIIRLQTEEDVATANANALEWEALLATGKVGDIVLGTVGRSLSPGISKAIDNFNYENPHSRVLVKQYGVTYGDDHSVGLIQLNNDIISGKCPDILLLHQDLSLGAYITKGVFSDLYSFIESDEAFNMTDYRENIFKAYEFSDSLYGIPLAFYVETMYAKASELSGKTKWTFDEFVAFAERFPSSLIFEKPTKTAVLDICLKANGKNIVDWASSDIGFDRALLIKMLDFSNRYVDADKYFEERSLLNRVNDGDIHLMTGIATTSPQIEAEIFGEPISQIGFPSENGNGYIILAYAVAAISSDCQFTDTAWSFIKYLLSDDVQSKDGLNGYPVKRSSIEPTIEWAKKGGGTIGGGFIDNDYISIERHGATDEEIKQFLDLLDTANEIRIYDMQIDSIIKEESEYYFNGNKSVDEVVNIIENRVGVYVKETK